MKPFFLRLGVILAFIFLQAGFVNVLLPQVETPVLILGAVMAWSLILPYPLAHFVTVPLAILFDAYVGGSISVLSLFTVVLAYSTGFLARRLMEHRGINIFLYVFFAAAVAMVYEVGMRLPLGQGFGAWGVILAELLTWPGLQALLQASLGACLSLLFAYWLIRHLENKLRFLKEREFLGMR